MYVAARVGYETAKASEVTMERDTRSNLLHHVILSQIKHLSAEDGNHCHTQSGRQDRMRMACARRAASEELTKSPFLISSTGVMISTVPLLILVGC